MPERQKPRKTKRLKGDTSDRSRQQYKKTDTKNQRQKNQRERWFLFLSLQGRVLAEQPIELLSDVTDIFMRDHVVMRAVEEMLV